MQTDHKTELASVIQASWFTIDPGTYVYASVSSVSDADKHLQIIRDGNEITVVTDISHLPLNDQIDINKEHWKMLSIRCGRPFYCVGFIASIADALAQAGIDMVITSTFTYDLVMVMEKDLDGAVKVLRGIGFKKE